MIGFLIALVVGFVITYVIARLLGIPVWPAVIVCMMALTIFYLMGL